MPVVSKRLSNIAKLYITEMHKQLESSIGKKVHRDYVILQENYLIPFFGKMHVTSITYETHQKFARWPVQQIGRADRGIRFGSYILYGVGIALAAAMFVYYSPGRQVDDSRRILQDGSTIEVADLFRDNLVIFSVVCPVPHSKTAHINYQSMSMA